jgi:hypothetical protein
MRTVLPRAAAVTALVTAAVAVTVVDAVNPQWSWVEVPVSNFVNGRLGALIPAALIGLALAAGIVVASTRERSRWALAVFAAGALVAAVFPAGEPGDWDDTSAAGTIHSIAGLTALTVLPVAVLLLTRAWRPVSRALSAARWVVVAMFAGFAAAWIDVLGGPQLSAGPYATVVGLAERALLSAGAVWLVIALFELRGREVEQ